MDQRLELRISAKQKAAIEEAAKGVGLPVSQWIRLALAHAVRRAKRAKLVRQPIPPTLPEPNTQRQPLAVPEPLHGEHPNLYEPRLDSWWRQQPDPANARDAAHRAFQDYQNRWPEIWKRLHEPKKW
jgi:antitoxin component of RelBE/YafQ-DinJ toxin-antitoxin module